MTQTTTQRHILEHKDKDAKMQTKKRKQNQTRWHKAHITSTKEAKHVITQMGRVGML